MQALAAVAEKTAMTRPRHIVPGRVCFVTARAVKRRIEFVPRREVVQIFGYLFALMADRFGMQVHEALCMSNHFHVLMTDVEGRLPEFMHDLDMLLARSLNALRGSSGSVFEKDYGLVIETDEAKLLEHAVYTLANPCAADLVRRSRQWPGFSTLRMEYGATVEFQRPRVGLWRRAEAKVQRKRKRPRQPGRAQHRGKPSRLPEKVGFTLVRPNALTELSDVELRSEVRSQLDARELALIEDRAKRGVEVVGRKEVLAQPWYGFPLSPEDLFGLVPRVAGRNKWARIQALQRCKEFERAHARARATFLAGTRDVVWPFGTWLMRVRYGLPCELAPP